MLQSKNFAAAAAISVVLTGHAVAQAADEGFQPSPYEFFNSCASCHGRDAKGAGFLTRVFRGVDPGDLTLLAANNDGVFPTDRVIRIIDGRAEVAAHGERRMPVWGDRYMAQEMREFGPDVQNEQRVRLRVLELMHFLQSIQEG